MTVTEVVDNFADGKLSIDDVVADFRARHWRVKPKGADESEAEWITEAWADTDSIFEATTEAHRMGVSDHDLQKMIRAYNEAPDKKVYTMQELLAEGNALR